MKNKDDDYFLSNYLKKSKEFNDESIISIGTNTTVQIVEDKKTKKRYVKKIFNFNDNRSIEYFNREVKLLKEANLNGFPFLRFYGFNPQEDGKSFILTEYLENDTLTSLIEDKFYNNKELGKYDTEKMKIFYGVAFGLKYLHNRNIIHRDIKPDNIFLDNEFNPYIGDFGFARVIQEGIKITGNIGTLYYMAPEIIKEEEEIEVEPDLSIDTYSFAVTVLQTLQCSLSIENDGEVIPVEEMNRTEFIKLIREGKRFTEINKVPDNFKQFITDCWSEDPQQRWSMDKILKSMKNHDLILKDCDLDSFDDYVNKLDEASNLHKHEEEEEKSDANNSEEDQEEETEEFDFQ